MSTSGTANYVVTRTLVIEAALRKIGAIGQGESASSTALTEGSFQLNLLLKEMQAQGMPLWAIKTTSFPLTQGTNSYPIGVGSTVNTIAPKKIIQAWMRDSTNSTYPTDTPMLIISKEQYNRLGSKSSQGTPNQMYYDPSLVITATEQQGTIYVFPTPDSYAATYKTMYISYQRPFDDMDNATDNVYFPDEWYNAIVWNLALHLCQDYGVSSDDKAFIRNMASQSMENALAFGTEEGSIFFGVDTYGM